MKRLSQSKKIDTKREISRTALPKEMARLVRSLLGRSMLRRATRRYNFLRSLIGGETVGFEIEFVPVSVRHKLDLSSRRVAALTRRYAVDRGAFGTDTGGGGPAEYRSVVIKVDELLGQKPLRHFAIHLLRTFAEVYPLGVDFSPSGKRYRVAIGTHIHVDTDIAAKIFGIPKESLDQTMARRRGRLKEALDRYLAWLSEDVPDALRTGDLRTIYQKLETYVKWSGSQLLWRREDVRKSAAALAYLYAAFTPLIAESKRVAGDRAEYSSYGRFGDFRLKQYSENEFGIEIRPIEVTINSVHDFYALVYNILETFYAAAKRRPPKLVKFSTPSKRTVMLSEVFGFDISPRLREVEELFGVLLPRLKLPRNVRLVDPHPGGVTLYTQMPLPRRGIVVAFGRNEHFTLVTPEARRVEEAAPSYEEISDFLGQYGFRQHFSARYLRRICGGEQDGYTGAKGRIYCYVEDNQLVGTMGVIQIAPLVYELKFVCVHPDYRRQGIASKMLAAVCVGAIPRGAIVEMNIAKANEAMVKFAKKHGFLVVDNNEFWKALAINDF